MFSGLTAKRKFGNTSDLGSPRKKAKLQHSTSNKGNSMVCRTSTKKRLIINKLVDIPQIPSNFQDKAWENLSQAIKAVHNLSPVSESKETLYGLVKDLCTHKMSAKLFELLQEQCKTHLIEISKQLQQSQNIDTLSFLSQLEKLWKDHCTQIRIIRDIFLYLDRTYVIHEVDVKSIWDMGLNLFRDQVIFSQYNPSLINKLISGILIQIEQERSGKTINRSLIQTLTRMLIALGIYRKTFEKEFLTQSLDFYHQESIHHINTINDQIPHYLKFIAEKIQEEKERVSFYLEFITEDELLKIVHNKLVLDHADTILEKGFKSMVNDDLVDDLHLLYKFFQFIHKLEKLKLYYNDYIKEFGLGIVMHSERDSNMIDDLLAFRRKVLHLLVHSFDKNEDFTHSMKEGFEFFINKRQNKPAELLARFIDEKLRRGQKKFSETELENILDEVLSLFRSIEGKDVFQGHYRKVSSSLKRNYHFDLMCV